jgi:hypothetical protein
MNSGLFFLSLTIISVLANPQFSLADTPSATACANGGFEIPGRVPFEGQNVRIMSSGIAGEVLLTSNILIPTGTEPNTFSGTGIDGQITFSITNNSSIQGYVDFNQSAADLARLAVGQSNGGTSASPICVTRLYVNMAFRSNSLDPNSLKIFGYTDAIVNQSAYVRLKPASAR